MIGFTVEWLSVEKGEWFATAIFVEEDDAVFFAHKEIEKYSHLRWRVTASSSGDIILDWSAASLTRD